jgi:phospholipase/carboxylesterase
MSNLKFFEHSAAKNPKYLVIFLHGYGSNGENLIELAHEFERILPDAHYISPNAIEPWEGGFPNAYQWFSLASWGASRDTRKVAPNDKNASQILGDFIAKQLDRLQLKPQNLFLVGFSQGAMMSMYQGLSMVEKPAGIISYSGKLILPEHLGEITMSKPNICLVHGELDSVLPFTNFLEAEKLLQENNIPFESHAIKNLDHTIDIHGIRSGMHFVKKMLEQ